MNAPKIIKTSTPKSCQLPNGKAGIECVVTYSSGESKLVQFKNFAELSAAQSAN